MDNSELLSAIYKLQKEATKIALAEVGLVSPVINKSQACEIYTRTQVEEWADKGLLKATNKKKGKSSTIYYSREDLVKLSLGVAEHMNVSPSGAKGTRRNKLTKGPRGT
ncbi:MAG: hypothetical protein BGO30_07600 [Bacteroidetes bacterium 41-46]|nr:MAG: hypothetical protein BGO30_07600 [Bacteroidetes bacterium 41-46]